MAETEKFHPSRRALTSGLAALAASGMAVPLTGALSGTAAAQPARQLAQQDAPFVVPALQQWEGGDGEFRLTSASRVVVPERNAQLRKLARTLTAELKELTGVQLGAPGTDNGAADEGEIRLLLDPSDSHPEGGERYQQEGSTMAVTDGHLTVKAPAYAGLFHATRSILQILVRDENLAIPAGTAVDWPDYAHRGFMLDVGRRYFTPQFLRDYVRALSWFKFNVFHLHLNDNEIEAPDGDWSKAQSAFRLASDDPAWSGLAAPDGSYDRATWDGFEELAEAHAMRLLPEFDAPAHSRAFVTYRPDIGLESGNSDHLDLAKPAATAFLRDLFTHFVPWFRSSLVHFGADEYNGGNEEYREYFNALAAHLRELGKQPVAWGSLSEMGGTAEGFDKDVWMYSWNNGWYGPEAIKEDGYAFLNLNDATLYVVPYADYYHGDGLDGRSLYENWAPHVFPDGQSVEPFDPALRGSLFAVWNDLVHESYTELDVHSLVNKTLGVLAQKMWSGDAAGLEYDTFQQGVDDLGLGPGLELLTR